MHTFMPTYDRTSSRVPFPAVRNAKAAKQCTKHRYPHSLLGYLVQGDVLGGRPGFGRGQRDAKDGVGAHVGLVVRSVLLEHELSKTETHDAARPNKDNDKTVEINMNLPSDNVHMMHSSSAKLIPLQNQIY